MHVMWMAMPLRWRVQEWEGGTPSKLCVARGAVCGHQDSSIPPLIWNLRKGRKYLIEKRTININCER